MTMNEPPIAGVQGQVDPMKFADAIGQLLSVMEDNSAAKTMMGQSLTNSAPLSTADDFLKNMQTLLNPTQSAAGGSAGKGGGVSTQDAIDTAVSRFTGVMGGNDPGSENAKQPEITAVSPVPGMSGDGGGGSSPNVGEGQSGNWIKDILKGIGAEDTPENERVLAAWIQAEGGTDHNNPLNTTQKEPGSTDWNYNGGYPVQAYSSYQQGLQATIQTLLQDNMSGIVAALRKGNNPMAVAQAIADSHWGTGDLVKQIIGGG